MEIQTELLKSQTTESLKALLDYSIQHETRFRFAYDKTAAITNADQPNGALEMYIAYSEIVRTLEDELGKRLEDIFIF